MTDRGYANPQLLWSAAELHAGLNDPQLCLIDTRAGEEYSQGHIPRGHSYLTSLGST
jgi:hypothetical protein